MNYSVFISCPKGLEYLLETEVRALGLTVTRVSPQGVYGEGSLTVVYHLCLWSRLANRVQIILFSGDASNEQNLKKLCTQYPWQTVFSPDKTLAIEFHGHSDEFRNTMFGALVVKDGIVDHFRAHSGTRPTIDKDNPQVRIHAYLKHETITVSLDLSGYSLHQRGYRDKAGIAPLKENVAAALLIRANWPQLAEEGYHLHDPFCGSGTLVIEAAMMAGNIAPGLLRQDQTMEHWAQHQPSLWEKLRAQALLQVQPIKGKITGSDVDVHIITTAQRNAERAGVAKFVSFKAQSIEANRATDGPGLIVANPPYGERMGETTALIPLYQEIGKNLHEHFQGWQAAILTSNPVLSKAMGLRATKQYTLFNGALECKLYCLSINAENQLKGVSVTTLSEGAQMLSNRLRKNMQHLKKWAKRHEITCYRIYDADLPEYNYAIDLYNDHAVLQEYAAPADIPPHVAEKRSLEVMQALPLALGINADKLVMKQRKQQKGTQQYQKLNERHSLMVVQEGKAQFYVNLYDYLDTGLFLDHRPLRLKFAELKPGTRFLNCFCYTASASVHAALAGAQTTNVDLSNTYLTWAEENFALNKIDTARHQFIQFDCLDWLQKTNDRFDVIFLDPPSFSNSKRMETTLDIQRDHIALIDNAMGLLNADGLMYFSTNLRHFKLDPLLESRYNIQNITPETIDEDFKRSKRIHQCYIIKALSQ